jgi:lysophospholipase L1-like esterase
MRPSVAGRVAAHASLVACGVLAALLLPEAFLRAAAWTPRRPPVRVRVSNAASLRIRAGVTVLDCYADDPGAAFPIDLRRPEVRAHYRALGFRSFAPALPESPWCVEFRYNSLGVRGPEYGPRRPGVARIVVIGDSFTEGQGVTEDRVYTSVLGERLQAMAPGRYEVLNFGYRGLDFPELYALFHAALRLQPDLILYGLCLNDGDRPSKFDKQWPRLDDWVMVRRPSVRLGPFDSRLLAFVRDRLDTWRISRDTTRWYLDMYGPANAAGWGETRRYLRTMRDEARARHSRLLVAIWPLLVGLDGRYPFRAVHEKLARVCERNGIQVYDLLPVLSGRSSRSLWVDPSDLHPNALAHRLVGEALAPVVSALLDGPAPGGARP